MPADLAGFLPRLRRRHPLSVWSLRLQIWQGVEVVQCYYSLQLMALS